jgi:hypothetical protein
MALPPIATLTPPDKNIREYYEHDKRLLEKINRSWARARWEEKKRHEELNRFLLGSRWEETIKELDHFLVRPRLEETTRELNDFLARPSREQIRNNDNKSHLMIPYIPTDFKNAYDNYLQSGAWRRARPQGA